jgi:hypothetical protein
MPEVKAEWVGEIFEFPCPNCNKTLSVALIAEKVIDEDTGREKTKLVDEECECGLHIEIFGEDKIDDG